MSSKLKVALMGLAGVVVMAISLLSWSYKNLGPLGSTQIPWAPVIWLSSILVLLLIPLYYCLPREA